MKPIALLLISALLFSCKSNTTKQHIDSSKNVTVNQPKTYADSVVAFEHQIYLKIDALHSGKVFTDQNGKDVFYRVLEIPEEENITLLAEKIAVLGTEGGNYKVIKLSNITADNALFAKSGLANIDSLKFIDSVNVQGVFDNKKMIINLEGLKGYHFIKH